MQGAVLSHWMLGWIGNVTSLALFLSPLATVIIICKKKAVEDYKPDPNIAMVMNCIFWVFYGIITPNSVTVISINSAGFILSLCYLAVYFYFGKKLRLKILLYLGGEVALTVIIACLALLVMPSDKYKSLLVGICSVLFGLILYSSPITIMKTVLRTKSVEYMQPWISVAGLCNGIIWAAYALIKIPPKMAIDPYILSGNGLGALSSISQLVLYFWFYGTPESRASRETKNKKSSGCWPWSSDIESTRPSKPEVQLSQV